MSDLLQLAERCEKATGPDANLDEAIEKSLPCSRRFAENNPHAPKTQWNERGAQFHGARIGEYDDFEEYKSPRYTTSLDAAMTLLPGIDWEFSLEWESGSLLYHPAAEMFGRAMIGDPTLRMEAEALTLPLALCAAALRARAAQ